MIPWNKGIRKQKPLWQLSIDDDGKLQQRFCNKRVNAKSENIPFDLTFEEYGKLVIEANLLSSDLGFTGNMYVLARYNDCGGYVYGNCRFITQKENAAEKVVSDCHRENSRRNAKLMNDKKYNRV